MPSFDVVSQVDMQEVRVWMGAASTLSRTRAGRLQTVVEWAQAGIVSQDDARRLLEHPDLERAMSLYDAAVESIENGGDDDGDDGELQIALQREADRRQPRAERRQGQHVGDQPIDRKTPQPATRAAKIAVHRDTPTSLSLGARHSSGVIMRYRR